MREPRPTLPSSVSGTSGRVAHISTVHPPEDPRIYVKQCRTLADAGYDVHLLVGGSPSTPGAGVTSHPLSRRWRRPKLRHQWPLQARALSRAWALRAGVYHLHDPHLIPLGMVLKWSGARVVYDVHEHHPQHARAKLAGRPVRARLKGGLYSTLESVAGRSFDAFVCASEPIGRRFPRQRTVVLHNYPSAHDEQRAVAYRDRPPNVVYLGVMRRTRGLFESLDAIGCLPRSLGCRLRLVGRVHPESLLAEARRHPAWRRVDYQPWVPRRVALGELRQARVALVAFHPEPNSERPDGNTKLYEYMAAGLPVVTSDMPAWRRLVEDVGCGLVVNPHDPKAIADAVAHLLANPAEAEEMGRRGQAAVAARFNWESEADRLLALYRSLAGPGG